MRAPWLLLLAVAACQCGEDPRASTPSPSDGGRADGAADGAIRDGGEGSVDAELSDGGFEDTGGYLDGSPWPDTGSFPDGGLETDAGTWDGGAIGDSGAAFDGGTGSDGGAFDSGAFDSGAFDSGAFDTGAFDSGAFDTGAFDSGAFDSGAFDSGAFDSGAFDSGTGAGNLFIEINYGNAFSSQSPAWTYSASPGWSPMSWDFTGGGHGAEAWDRFNNMSVVSDPIGGNVLEIGGSSELQLMFGLVPMSSYTTATVEIEGRSRACCSPVAFDVYNPATGCGASATMSQDWTADIVVLDLSGCFVPGSALQAVRVDPTSGNVALRRMRLSFSGAVW